MRRLLLAAIATGGLLASAEVANAQHLIQEPRPYARFLGFLPHSSSVTWPSAMPPGWYTDTYYHRWYFPWYAYYNFSQGPYANWMAGGGYAGYANHGPAGYFYYPNREPAQPYTGGPSVPPGAKTAAPTDKDKLNPPKELKDSTPPKTTGPKEGTVRITLPNDAKLLFNGVAASGTGNVRTFQTPPLAVGQNYRYELTAEVVRDGRTERITQTVVVRAGEKADVTLAPVITASAK